MMNDYSQKTLMRTRGLAQEPASRSEQSINVLPIGTRLGEFEIMDLIGEGGFGIVYLAYDHSLERRVALKEYMPSGFATRATNMAVTVRSEHDARTFTAGLKSFVNEAKMLARFDSPSLVKVHRFWEGNGTAYMVMPYYEGITLKQALKEHRIKPTESWIRLLLDDLSDAIETIHSAHCYHRDIAPDNILLLKDGRPLLLDFGAARRMIGDLTQCLTVIVKPGFAPIEQYADIAGLRQGPWTDIYALGAVVYYLIAGVAPVPAVARVVRDELVPAREIGNGRFSAAFLAVVDKALEVRPENRFQSIAELRQALGESESMARAASQRSATRTQTMPAESDDTTVRTPAGDPHVQPSGRSMTWKSDAPAAMISKRSLPKWLITGVLLSAGIASGLYWGTWYAKDRQRSVPVAVSGSSGASGEETPGEALGQTPQVATNAQAAPAPSSVQTPPSAAPPAETGSVAKPAPATLAPPVPPAVPAPSSRTDTPAAPASGAAPNASRTARMAQEEEAWRKAASADRSSSYESYLKEYPNGRYAAIARQRLESRQPKVALATPGGSLTASAQKDPARSGGELPATAKMPSFAEEKKLWDSATLIASAPAYEAYLNKYPTGRFAALAKDRLAALKSPVEPASTAPVAPVTPAASAAAPSASAPAKPPQAQTPSTESAAKTMPEKQASVKPLAPPPSVARSQPEPATASAASAEQASTAGKKTLKAGNQTMIGDFSSDPVTGIVSGTGKIVWTNGDQFDGTLVKGMKEGKGEFIWHNNQRYNGEWSKDMPNGKGAITYANGNRYQGDVKDGLQHGEGTFWFKNGDVYQGTWVRGKSHGHGRYTWANGGYWEGEFRDDQRTDNGKMVFAQNAAGAEQGRK